MGAALFAAGCLCYAVRNYLTNFVGGKKFVALATAKLKYLSGEEHANVLRPNKSTGCFIFFLFNNPSRIASHNERFLEHFSFSRACLITLVPGLKITIIIQPGVSRGNHSENMSGILNISQIYNDTVPRTNYTRRFKMKIIPRKVRSPARYKTAPSHCSLLPFRTEDINLKNERFSLNSTASWRCS